MKIAYVVNQYPKASHSFIRREIAALESAGLPILRCSIRRSADPLADPADEAELRTTHTLLPVSIGSLIRGLLLELCTHSRASCLTVVEAFRLARGTGQRMKHVYYLVEALLLANRMRRERVTHIHAHFGTNAASVACLLASHLDLPWSFTVHGPEEFDQVNTYNLRWKARSSKFVVAISSFGRTQMWRQMPYRMWDKVKIVRCGLDQSFKEAATKLPTQLRLLCIGRLAEQKGHAVLIEAISTLKSRGIQVDLVIAGDGPLRAELELLIARLDLQERVKLRGWLSEAQVREELLNCRMMVMPSFAEGLPVAIMEAMALGRPVIASSISGIPELIKDNTSGFLCTVGDPTALADSIARVLVMPEDELDRIISEGYRLVWERHDVTRETQALLNHFAEEMPKR